VKTLAVFTNPIAKPRARVTVRDGQKPRSFTPRTAEANEWRIRERWVEKYGSEPSEAPIHLRVLAYLPMPLSTPKSRRLTALPVKRPDLDNFVKTVLDALNGVAFRDDSQVVFLSAVKWYASSGTAPHWELAVEELDVSRGVGEMPALPLVHREQRVKPEEEPGAAWGLLSNREAHEQVQRGSGYE
jgi:Holliday junction resolvase RusA-like endonuclease